LRTQAGQAQANMALPLGRLGPDRTYKILADWTDRIEKGELPASKPQRPQGVERNVVITEWDWSTPSHYMHDLIATDKRNPTINANGKVWGSPEESTDEVPWLDPVTNTAGTVKHPFRDPKTPSSLDLSQGPSAYWGDKPIWDGHTSIHNPMMDEKGRVWFTARIRGPANPDYCKKGSDFPSAQVAPLNESPRQLSVYDPKTDKWKLIDTCFATQHLNFGHDKNNTLWTSAGGPQSGVVGWLNVAKYEETGDEKGSQGWTPIVIDTVGSGKRDDADKRIPAAFYAVQSSPVDDSVWGQSMDAGFSRMDQVGYVMRLVPGADPTHTALTEVYATPEGTWGPRGLDLASDGVVWTALASGHLASFDRRKCKGPLNGPQAADGKICPEGWTVYRMPGPQFKGVDEKGSANHAYYIWVDRDNTLGLGKNVPIASANGSESLLAVVDGKLVDIRVPYPLGFFTKNVDGRIDDPNAGWKGRAVWTTFGSRAVFHNEGGSDNRPKVYKIQVRPDPLAH
ncbi:MAG: carboxypeptidase regulatory-like domain-containing protein, partial [Alphaproteobacteria bacterium]|nr:carboxypeptidase regulatory-like domain-containing protein [Alphaproteobacteria bacterium]